MKKLYIQVLAVGNSACVTYPRRVTRFRQNLSHETVEILMNIPPEIPQQIQDLRRDNSVLTANISDEEILLLLQQADLAMEHGKPMSFLLQNPKGAGNPLAIRTHLLCLPRSVERTAKNCSLQVAGSKRNGIFLRNWKKQKTWNTHLI